MTPRSMTFLLGLGAVALMLTTACQRAEAIEQMPAGTEVTVMTQDGTLVRGKIAKVEPELVTLTGERPNTTTEITRTSISEVKRVGPEERDAAAPPVVIDGVAVIPAGASLSGHVTHVDDSDKVKGRAELSFRFTRLTTGSVTYDIDTRPLSYVAEGTKKEDAVKIGTGAAAGAIIGAIAGGKKGAVVGTAIGAGAGTGVVLATDGKEIRLAEGRKLKVSLTNPLTIRTK